MAKLGLLLMEQMEQEDQGLIFIVVLAVVCLVGIIFFLRASSRDKKKIGQGYSNNLTDNIPWTMLASQEEQKEEEVNKYDIYFEERAKEKYDQLIKAWEKIQKLNPKWSFNKNITYIYPLSLKAELPDEIIVSLDLDKRYDYPGSVVRLSISQQKVHIYGGEFMSNDSTPSGKKSYQLLHSYIENIGRPIIEGNILTIQRAKENKEKEEQSIRDKFWND